MEQSTIRRQVKALLSVEDARHSPRAGRTWLIVVAAGVGNLMIGAHFEYLASGNGISGYVPMFLLCECGLVCMYVSALFFGEQHLLLLRTRVFPLRAGVRFIYAVASILRRPEFLLFWLTGTLVVGTLCRPDVSQVVAGALFFSWLLCAVCTLLIAGYLLCVHRGWPPGAAALILFGIALFAMVASAFVPRGSLIAQVPIIAWVADAIRDAGQGDWAGVAANGALFLVLFAGVAWIAKEYA